MNIYTPHPSRAGQRTTRASRGALQTLIYIYIYIYVCVCVCVYIIYINIYTHTYIHIYIYIHTHTSIYLSIYLSSDLYIYIYIYIYIYVCIPHPSQAARRTTRASRGALQTRSRRRSEGFPIRMRRSSRGRAGAPFA